MFLYVCKQTFVNKLYGQIVQASIPRVQNEKFSGCCFHMNTIIQEDFQICISECTFKQLISCKQIDNRPTILQTSANSFSTTLEVVHIHPIILTNYEGRQKDQPEFKFSPELLFNKELQYTKS